ncbi:gephyrin-like molybdotransferase receptor GlpR [uncultured Corynebacterium sp.]|uniref:divisome protein SepX/GlpR n=1 Tax=uncultured Corynebacterium sp. TaxID=159447 RepID=UPI00259B2B4D|nr:gephyrin-like molybdotransferase receptor GlpR [uncultured Corynebacterium sp.]
MIILILVVWIIVLAPLMIGNNKPIRRSGEGYEETRVLHEGGTAPMAERRRPKLTAADIHRHSEEDDYEVVEATDAEEDVLIDDAPALRSIFRRPAGDDAAQPAHVEGEVVEHDADDEREAAAEDAAVENDEAEQAPATTGGSTKVTASETGGSTSVKVLAAEDGGADEQAESAEADADRYELDESFTTPEDYGYADAQTAEPEQEEANGDDNAPDEQEAAADAAEQVDSGDVSEEDIAFAASRRGRGGYDPERERSTAATRFQRRQRTLLGLTIACVITFVIAFVAGGWTWVLPAVAVGLTAWFMIALRKVVLKERALKERRLRQLRRARMGVATAEAHARDRHQRAGSVVLDLDDESPDFDTLPSARFAPTPNDTDDGYGNFRSYGARAS